MKVKATTKDGATITIFPRDPMGHTNNPMKDEDITSKFSQCADATLGKERTAAALERWWNIQDASATGLAYALAVLDLP